MNKKLLSSFFIAFAVFYIALFAVGIFLHKTGRSFYKTHTAKQFENDQYYAQNFNKNDAIFLANSSSEVQAFNPVTGVIGAFKAIALYGEIANNAPGYVKTQMVGLMEDSIYSGIAGCSVTEYQALMEEASTMEEVRTSEKCPGKQGAIINNIGVTNLQGSRPSSGLFALYSRGTEGLAEVETNLFNDSLYAQDLLNQVPVLGEATSKKIFAAEDTQLSKFALDDAFFKMWKTNLNLTYYLIIIPTVAFGFAIMFRMQIGPQTQVTLMKAIPRILVTILLITFSFPIASIMVRFGKVLGDIAIGMVWTMAAVTPAGSFQFVGIGSIFSVLGDVLEGISFLIMLIPLVIILLITAFRMLFAYFNQMIRIGFLIAFSPIILLFSAFPGKEGVMKNYFKTLAAHIMGYFAIFVLFNASFAVMVLGWKFWEDAPFLLPIFFWAASLGILWKAPSAPKLIQEMIGVEPLLGGGDPKKR